MADVVGTAFVKIRAITSGLAKDIEKGVSKGVKDADFDKSGEIIGDGLVKGASKKVENDSGDSIKNSLEKAIGHSNFGKASGILSKKISEDFNKSFDVNFRRAINSGDLEGAGRLIRKKLSLEKQADASATGFLNTFKKRISSFVGLDDAGKKAGKRFGGAFSGGLIAKIIKIGALLLPLVAGLVSLAIQYVVALTAQIGLLVVAATGAGVAIGTVLGAAGLAIIPLMLAFKANTKQLAAFKEVATGVGEAWQEVGAATQETLLPGLTRALKLTKKLIPEFRAFGREVGRTAGKFAELSMKEIVGDQARLQTILRGSARIFESLGGVVFNFVSIFLDVFKAAIPIGEQFAAALGKMSDRWQNLIGASSDSGQLTATFQGWYDKAVLVGSALGDLFAAMWNILSVGADSAVPFFQNFATWAENFRAFTESSAGQNRLKQIFDDALEVAHEFNGLLVDIGRRIGGAVFEEGGNEGIIEFIRLLREDVVPIVDRAFRAMRDELGPSLKDLGGAFGDFLTKLSEGDTLKVLLETMSGMLVVFTKLLSIPGFAEFIGFLGGLAGIAKLLKALGIISLFSSLGAAIGFLAGGFVEVLATGGIGTFIAGLGGPVAGAASVTLGAVALAIGAIVAAVALAIVIFKNWDTIVQALKDAFNAFVGFFKEPMSRIMALKENIENLLGSLRELGGKVLGIVGRAFAKLGSIVKEKVEDAVGSAADALGKVPGAVGRALGGLAKAVGSALAKLPGQLTRIGASLIEAFAGAAVDLVKALPGLFLKVIGFFIALPFRIFFALAGFAKNLLVFFVEAVLGIGLWLAANIGPTVVDFFSKLPGRIIGVLDTLGDTLRDLFDTVVQKVIDFLVEAIPKVLQFFKDLPGNILGALDTLGDTLRELFLKALDLVIGFITEKGPEVLQWFMDLPGKIGGFLADLPGTISGAFSTAFDAVKTALSDFITVTLPAFGGDMLAAGGAIIDKLVEGLGKVISGAASIGKDIANSVIKFINKEIIRKLNSLLTVTFKKGPINITISAPDIPEIPQLKAQGDIFRRATNIIAGEAGDEVLIPLTKPRRALELFNQSGLAAVLAQAQGSSGSGATSAGRGGRGGAVFQEGSIQVVAQGVSASAVIDEMNAKLGWQLTTRGDR